MYPLLKKDGLTTQYFTLTLFWNFLIGYNPLKLRQGSVVKLLSLVSFFSHIASAKPHPLFAL